ncbi:MAG: tetratricopeptide repeat protein [Geitlerinemataceae cyanobacterium]
MRPSQLLAAGLTALSLVAGNLTPALALPTPDRAAQRQQGQQSKAGSEGALPLAESEQFDAWFETCANAEPAEALVACERATELAPDFAIAWDNLGAVLEQLGRYEEALAALDRALVLTPEDANIWYNVGVVFAKLGQYRASVAAFEEAFRLNPEDELARKFAELLRDRLGE